MHVHKGLLEELGCPLTGDHQGTVGAHGTSRQDPLYRVTLNFPNAQTTGEVVVVGMELQGRSYHAILGTEFLRTGVFHLDFRGDNYFEFHPTETGRG
jgi:hypothetical protein